MAGVGPGTVLAGRYRLTEHIAGGGMGDVWRGVDDVLARTIAVKILLPTLVAEAGFAARFRDEARTMATINHPGVVDVYDYGTDGGVTFLVMEYVDGDALSKTLARVGRLTPQRTMSLIAQAADALQAAHDKGIVHRDVKPANLLVRPNGTLVLTDFGISRREAAARNLTAVGSVLGTASYISPEQASGHGASPLSDVYALGVVAYQCLSGRRPFEGGTPLEIAVQHVEATPPPLPPDIPRPIRALVERCLAKPPATRFPSAAALAAAARAAGSGQSMATQPLRPAAATQALAMANGSASARSAVGAAATVPVSGTQIMAPQSSTYPAYRGEPVGKPAGRPPRNRAAVITLGIILAIIIMLVAALIASVIKRHVYATDAAGPTSLVSAMVVTPAGTSVGGVAAVTNRPTSVDRDRSADHATTEGLTR